MPTSRPSRPGSRAIRRSASRELALRVGWRKIQPGQRIVPPPPIANASPPQASRLASLDVFRGVVITAMILVNGEYSHATSYRPLAHAAWNGWTCADVIFPAFLFLVGVSLTYSMAARRARGQDTTRLAWHALRRSVLLFAVGVAIDNLRVPAHVFPFVGLEDHLQLTGVLQKIAACDLVASLIYLYAGLRGVVVGAVALNVIHSILLYAYPVPGCGPGILTVACNFPGYLDETALHGLRWNGPGFDPDGLGTILPATTSVLLGILAGHVLRGEARLPYRLARLLGGAVPLIVAAELLAAWIPINKQLWTTSFALLTAGLAAMGLVLCVVLVDGSPRRAWSRPLEILGRNAIAAYLASRILVNVIRVHIRGRSLYGDVLARLASPRNASLLFATVVVAAVFCVVLPMDRKGWRLKF
jgi:predicted acyltransferase